MSQSENDIKLNEYCVTVYNVNHLDKYKFCTDLKQFVEALQSRNDKGQLKLLFEKEEYKYLSTDTKLAIAANLGNEKMLKSIEGGMDMCRALDELIEDGRIEGSQLVFTIYKDLVKENRKSDAERFMEDEDYQKQMLLIYEKNKDVKE